MWKLDDTCIDSRMGELVFSLHVSVAFADW